MKPVQNLDSLNPATGLPNIGAPLFFALKKVSPPQSLCQPPSTGCSLKQPPFFPIGLQARIQQLGRQDLEGILPVAAPFSLKTLNFGPFWLFCQGFTYFLVPLLQA